MAGKLLLCVAATHATAAYWRRGKLLRCRRFSHDADGWEGFQQYLRQAPQATLELLLDVVEEDYRCVTLPHARGRDRAEMLARKIKQLYPATPYAGAWLQGRERGQRRDDAFLFAALTNPALPEQWLRIIEQQQAPLSGIYLLPLLGRQLARRLKLQAADLLLLDRSAAGLRLTFFHDGLPRFSRLTRLAQPCAAIPDSAYAEEIADTCRYLETLKMLAPDQPLSLVMLDPSDALIRLEPALAPADNWHCSRLDAGRLAATFGLDLALLRQCPESLYLKLLGTQRPPANLAAPALTAGYRYHRARSACYSTGLAVAAAAIGWSGYCLQQLPLLEAEAAQLAGTLQRENQRYAMLNRQPPSAPAAPEVMQQTVEAIRAIQAARRSPQPLFAALGRALDAHPGVTLKNLRWHSDDSGRHKAAGNRPYALIEAEILPLPDDDFAAVDYIQRFAEQLKQQQEVAAVTLEQLPHAIGSAALSGNTGERPQAPSSTPFRLSLALRAKP